MSANRNLCGSLRRLAPVLIIVSLIVSGCSGESSTPQLEDIPPSEDLVRTDVGDVAALYAKWQALPLGGVIDDLVREGGNGRADAALEVIAGMHALRVAGSAADEGPAPIAMRGSLELENTAAERLWQLIGLPADAESGSEGDVSYRRDDGVIHLATHAEPSSVAARAIEHDLVFSWQAEAWARLAEGAPEPARTLVTRAPGGHYLLTITDTEAVEHVLLDRPIAGLGLRPLAGELSAWVPDQALIAGAVGLDLTTLVGHLPEDVAANLRARLQPTGIDADALLADLSGTWAVWVEGMAIGLQCPNGPEVERLLGVVAAQVELTLPEPGASVALPAELTAELTRALPVPLTVHLARRDAYWLLTTSGVLAREWAAGEALGSGEGAVAAVLSTAADEEAFAALAYDTGAIARAGSSGLGLLGGRLRPQQRESIQQVLEALATAPVGAVTVRDDEQGARVSLRGQVPLPALVVGGAAIVLPAIARARARAQRARTANDMRHIIVVMVTYTMEHNEWPAELETLITYAGGDMTPEVLRSPEMGDRPPLDFIYVPPRIDVPPTTPVLVQDIAASLYGDTIVVGFADGQVRTFSGPLADDLSQRARELAAAIAEGRERATGDDWADLLP